MTVEELEKRLKKINDDLIVTTVKREFEIVGFFNMENHTKLPGSVVDGRAPNGTIEISLGTKELFRITPYYLSRKQIEINPLLGICDINFLTDVLNVLKDFIDED